MEPDNQGPLPSEGDRVMVHEPEGEVIGTVTEVKDLSYGATGSSITIDIETSNVSWMGETGQFSFGARDNWDWVKE